MNRTGDNGTRDIGAASREGLDAAIRHRAVEARNDSILDVLQAFSADLIRPFLVKVPMCVEQDHFGRIDKTEAEIGGKQLAVQILSAGGRIVASCLPSEIISDQRKLRVEVHLLHMKTFRNLPVSSFDLVQSSVDVLTCRRSIIALVEQICDLRIIRETSAWRGRNDIPSEPVSLHNLPDFRHLPGTCERTSAELCNLQHKLYPLFSATPVSVYFYLIVSAAMESLAGKYSPVPSFPTVSSDHICYVAKPGRHRNPCSQRPAASHPITSAML